MPYIGKELSVNYYKVTGRGGRPTNKTRPEVELWMDKLGTFIKEREDYLVFRGRPLIVELTGYFQDGRHPDLHNLHKVIADALQSALGINDKYIRFRDLDPVVGALTPTLDINILEVSQHGQKAGI